MAVKKVPYHFRVTDQELKSLRVEIELWGERQALDTSSMDYIEDAVTSDMGASAPIPTGMPLRLAWQTITRTILSKTVRLQR